jgi:hypothetical protein
MDKMQLLEKQHQRDVRELRQIIKVLEDSLMAANTAQNIIIASNSARLTAGGL